MVWGEGGLTVGGDHPEDVGDEEVGEGAGNHEEEFCVLVVDAPEFEGLEEGLARWGDGGGCCVLDNDGVGARVLVFGVGAGGFKG